MATKETRERPNLFLIIPLVYYFVGTQPKRQLIHLWQWLFSFHLRIRGLRPQRHDLGGLANNELMKVTNFRFERPITGTVISQGRFTYEANCKGGYI